AQDGYRRPLARLDGGAEGGVDPAHALLDLEALLAQELREPRAGLDFLVSQLGIRVDLLGKGLQLVGEAVHRLRNGVFDGTHRGLRGVRDFKSGDRLLPESRPCRGACAARGSWSGGL